MGKGKEAWYQLSKEEQASLVAKMQVSFDKVGGKNFITADSRWSYEEWQMFGVNEYPDLDSLMEHNKDLQSIDWFRYFDTKVILGTEWEDN